MLRAAPIALLLLLAAAVPAGAAEVRYATVKYSYFPAADGGVAQGAAPGSSPADRAPNSERCYYAGGYNLGRHCWKVNASHVSVRVAIDDCPGCVATGLHDPAGGVAGEALFLDAAGATLASTKFCGASGEIPVPAGAVRMDLLVGGAAGVLACGNAATHGTVTYVWGFVVP